MYLGISHLIEDFNAFNRDIEYGYFLQLNGDAYYDGGKKKAGY